VIRSSLSKDIKIQIHLFKFGIQLSLIYFPSIQTFVWTKSGVDPGFQVRGGGELKKIAPNGGRRENLWGISCEKSRFYAKKSYFFQF